MDLTKQEKALMEIYRRVYSELGVDIDKLIEDGTTKKEGWFMDYEMSVVRQQEIIEEVLKENRIPKYQKRQISIAYWLGGSPRGKKHNEK